MRRGTEASWRRAPTFGAKLLRIDWLMLSFAAALAVIGTATLYSVADGSFQPWAERHALRFLLGVALVIAMGLVPPAVWLRLGYPFYGIALAALALVPILGNEALGARRWITLAGLSFQPSEIMKLALIAALARYYHWLAPERVSQLRWMLPPLVMIALPVILNIRQPDLGSAVLCAVIGVATMFLAGVAWHHFALGGLALLALLPFGWHQLHDYQRRRIEVFLDPEMDPLGAGYHIAQSKIALGSGGVGGKGFMMGTQSRLDFLPEKHTDFAFTMFAEEWGFIGALVLMGLVAALIALTLLRSARAPATFTRLVTAGFGVSFATYTLVNIAMATGLVPVVGVPLPLVSYGGTAMLSLMATMGLAMSGLVHGSDIPERSEIGPFV